MQANYCLPLPEDFQPLPVPVPPMLEAALGYTPFRGDEACFVTFYWSPFGDEACFDDGRTSGTGDWQGFLAYIDHISVGPALGAGRYQLGSSEEVNTHRLLLDRRERKLYLVEDRAGCLVLFKQWQTGCEPEPAASELFELHPGQPEIANLGGLLGTILDQWEEMKPPSHSEIEAFTRKRESILSELFLWLDSYPATPLVIKDRQHSDNRPG